jgi:outer membrane lipoprotein carrier protein
MTSRLALLGIMGLATTTAFAAPVRQTAALQVQHYVDGLTSLRAEFRQLVSDARGRVIERAEGTMALSRPGRFRWDYRVPPQLIVSDGQTVWLYDVDLAQVTIRPAGEALAGTPAMLLAGGGDLADEFAITDAGRDEGLAWSLLVPRRADADFREVRLGFAGPELRRMVMLDRLGQTTDLEFLQVERNPRLDASLFSFEPPAGVDVVGRAQGR